MSGCDHEEACKVCRASSRSTGGHSIGASRADFAEFGSAVAHCSAVPRDLWVTALEKKLATDLQLSAFPSFVSHTDTGMPIAFHEKPAVLK